MASFDIAIEYVLRNEDDSMSGKIENVPGDHGGRTRWGVTESAAKGHGYSIDTLTKEQASSIYKKYYWPAASETLKSQRVATKLLDMCVNIGPSRTMELLEIALHLERVKNAAVRTLDTLSEEQALELLSLVAASFYVTIVEHNPTQIKFLAGWINRAIRRPPQ